MNPINLKIIAYLVDILFLAISPIIIDNKLIISFFKISKRAFK
jgi:hypothetical protein